VTRALIRKELREHLWLFLALMALHALTLMGLLSQARDDGSVFTALQQFTVSMGVLGVLVANSRLVVREYSGRTQLFLETLPVTRLRILTVKLLLGFATVLLPVAIVLGICALAGQGREPITPRYLAILALRSGVFLLTFHALGFLAGMLGRYRYVFWAGCFYLMSVVMKKESFDNIPLFRLVDQRMAFERNVFPLLDLGVMTAVAILCLAAAFALGLMQEGGLAANLARKMSHREKVFFGGLLLIIIVIESTVDERRKRPRFDLAAATRSTAGATFVGIATTDDEDAPEAAMAVGTALAEDLESLRIWLDLRELPPVFVVPDSSLDPSQFVRAELEDTDGVVMKAGLSDPAFDGRWFRTTAVDEVLAWYSRNRSRREAVSWFPAGLSGWWVDRLEPDPRLRLRAAAAGPVTREELRDWLTTREKLGPCLAQAVEVGLVEVVKEQNPDGFQALATRLLGGERPGQDFRASLFRKSVEVDLDQVVKGFAKRVAADRLAFAEDLAKRQQVTTQLDAKVVGRGSGIELHHAVQSDGGDPVDYTVRYATLKPWAGEKLTLLSFSTQGSGVLPQVFPRGTRLFSSFDIDEPALGCVVRHGAQRQELQ